jgi:spore coat protein A
LLPAPLRIESFVIAPGERVDLILDFRDSAGEHIILRSDSFELLQFRVNRTKVSDDSSLPSVLRAIEKIPETSAVKTRVLTIDEYMNHAGDSMLMLLNGAHWKMPVTETPVLDSVEIWSIVNPTDDSHPIHLHLVRFQVLDRRQFSGERYKATREILFMGSSEPGAE